MRGRYAQLALLEMPVEEGGVPVKPMSTLASSLRRFRHRNI